MTQLVQNVPNKISGACHWNSAAGEMAADGISVTLEAGIVETLRHEVLTAFRAVPRRGMETGGILLGRVNNRSPLSITVEQAETISCEHRSGPAFNLSESDRTQLANQLSRPPKDGLAVVGYYRSCTGREMYLDGSDQDLIREFWPEADHVFLLMKPISIHECVAAFLFRRDGELQIRPEHPPFTFRTGAPAPAPTEASEPLREERHSRAGNRPDALAAADPEHDLTARDAQSRLQTRLEGGEPRRRLWQWALACVTLFIALLAGREFWTPVAEPQWGQLGLNVSPTASGLEVSWDSSKPEVRNARRGVLTIAENDSTSEVELNRAALAHGTFHYRQSGNDVLVRLRVDGAARKAVGETFRFVSESAGRTSFAADTAGNTTRSRPDETEPVPPPQTADVRAVSALPAAGTTEPEPDKQTEQQAGRRIAAAAKAIHEVQPFVSEGIRARLRERVVVPVTVSISESGQVVSAAPQRGGDAIYRYLASRAAQAAKSWRFKPARGAGNSPSASSKTLHFVFTP